jgi:hypothetical protein
MEVVQQQSWFKRNWKWFVPTVGCGTLIILFIFGVVGLVFGVTNFISNSTPAEYAIERASQNQVVVEALGTPIEQTGMVSGSLSFGDDTGDADLKIPIEGPKGKGRIYVVGTKTGDDWTYSELYVWIEGSSDTVDLLENELEAP